MVPAWPQPPPPRCFAIAEAAGATAAAVYAEDCVRLRGEGKGSISRPGVSKSGRRRGRPQAGPLRPRTWPRAAAARPARSGKAPAPPLGKDHAGAGAAGRRDGGNWQSLRDPRSPDLPPLPPPRGCGDGIGAEAPPPANTPAGREAADGLEADLARHLETEHADDLEPVAARLLRPCCPDALLSVYNAAVAQRCRADAPLAGCSLDRTALRSFAKATAKDSVEALICFCCACVYTRARGKGAVSLAARPFFFE